MTKDKKQQKTEDLEQIIGELTLDLQRTRADFENYRKRTEQDIVRARETGKAGAVLKLLPVIDNIERAIAHVPESLKEDKWAQGVTNLVKNLEKSMEALGVSRINAKPGTPFDPELHEAVASEDGDGNDEIVSEELQAGYQQDGKVIRPSIVKVKK